MTAQLASIVSIDPKLAITADLQPVGAPTLMSLSGVGKRFGSHWVLKDINLELKAGEFLAIVGFSGSGKSTLISLLSGLVRPDAGTILMNDQELTGPGPDRGVVFQNYSLMPWMTVRQNVALAVDTVFRHQSAAERQARVEHYIAMVGLRPAIEKRPAELSGGMRQRVAVARALAMDPAVLLLDEPLSALDALTRAKLQDEILSIWEQERKTVLLITNDVDEALLMADRVIALQPGPEAALGTEFEVTLSRPRDRLALNHDIGFQRLRKTITAELLEMGASRAAASAEVVALPSVKPNTAAEFRQIGALHSDQLNMRDSLQFCALDKVSKIYPSPRGTVKVVDGFDLNIAQGEFVSLIGHSGCGKSTVLAMLAGLTDISEGGITLDYREIDGPGPDRGIVFQAPSLVPWLTARENVLLGINSVFPHASKTDRHAIAQHYLGRVGLADAIDRRASDLSNGMRQRVGIARAFALQPKLLLLDEPFGMLDSLTRWELQEVLMEVWVRDRLTALMVTHDVDEAILLADRVVMMTNGPNARVGRVLQVDLPRPRTRRQLLDHPDYYRYREAITSFLAECDHAH